MTELAFDLVCEILARVPVKDLLRFRCVCKSWRSLFQDEGFIRKHITHAPSMFLLADWWPLSTLRTCTYEGRKLKMVLQEPELNNGGEKDFLFKTSVIGHCDGLFCLELQDTSLAVCNPALRELTKVPRIDQQQTRGMRIGFCYDHSIQDHKIVLMPLKNCSKAHVLTLKSSVSRMIDFPWRQNCELMCKKEGILVGEYIFWPLYAHESTIENSENILSFSVVSETFNYCSGPGGESRVLKVLRGSLCAVDYKDRENYCHDMVVWCADHEKEDKGRIKSWTKILTLTASDIQRSTRWQVVEFRLGAVINRSGLLLLLVQTREIGFILYEYNLEKDTMRQVDTCYKLNYLDNLEEYIASLVSY
ncbi:F-box domain [Arabidopsis suecica]|uniref:F-box domain n=1 Tax=Arabidopsis suecica TaxID=45249 RepID=A0A8T2ALG3_ARASU|nr:F-box domain [Arabidopsis suecica]